MCGHMRTWTLAGPCTAPTARCRMQTRRLWAPAGPEAQYSTAVGKQQERARLGVNTQYGVAYQGTGRPNDKLLQPPVYAR